MKLVAILAVAALALAGCTQQHTTSAGAPPTTSTTDNTVWVPVTGPETTTTTPATAQVAVAPKPPVAPAGYVPFDYELPPHPPAGGSALNMVAPAGWARSQNGDKTDFRDPTGQLLVQFEQVTSVPTPSPLTTDHIAGLLRQRAQATQGEYANYHEITLGPTTLGQYDLPGAQWQFTFTANGVTRQVTVLGTMFLGLVTVYVSGPQQYASVLASITAKERATINGAG